MNQGEKALSRFVRKATRQNRQLTRVFGSQGSVNFAEQLRADAHTCKKVADDTHIRKVHRGVAYIGNSQTLPGKLKRLEIRLYPCVAIDFGAKLKRLPGGMGAVRTRMQHRTAIAETRHSFAIKQMCVNTSHLGRRIGP